MQICTVHKTCKTDLPNINIVDDVSSWHWVLSTLRKCPALLLYLAASVYIASKLFPLYYFLWAMTKVSASRSLVCVGCISRRSCVVVILWRRFHSLILCLKDMICPRGRFRLQASSSNSICLFCQLQLFKRYYKRLNNFSVRVIKGGQRTGWLVLKMSTVS